MDVGGDVMAGTHYNCNLSFPLSFHVCALDTYMEE